MHPDAFLATNVFRMKLIPWQSLEEFDLKLAEFIGWSHTEVFPVIRYVEIGRPDRFVTQKEAQFLTAAYQSSTIAYKKLDRISDFDEFLENEKSINPVCVIAKDGKSKLTWKPSNKHSKLIRSLENLNSEERAKYFSRLDLNIIG